MEEEITKTQKIEKSSKSDFKDKYFIKDIENITGIKAYTIRIWEQRYNLLEPKRTETNIRYYEEDDLKHMLNISILNNNGWKISKIAKLSREDVHRKALGVTETASKYSNQIQALSASMIAFDEREFNKILNINILKLGMEETMISIIFPFLEHIGLLWLGGSIHPAHEHFITNLIRQRLYVNIDQLSYNQAINPKKYLLFVPSGENHDLSLLFAQFILRARGQQVIYLGTATPLEELNNIFKFTMPDYIFCSLTATNTSIPTPLYVQTLSRSWPKTTIILTGNQILKRKDLSIPSNCVIVRNVSDFLQIIEHGVPTNKLHKS